MTFNPHTLQTFRFTRYTISETRADSANEKNLVISLRYAFDDSYFFTEELIFPHITEPLTAARREALDKVVHALHLVAGISYYKAAAPPNLQIETAPISAQTARFMDKLYLQGLGEFAYRNGLNLQDKIHFPGAADLSAETKPSVALPRRAVLPIGGGKDSLVSLEILRAGGEPVTLFSVGNPPIIREVAAQTGLPHLVVNRRLSPQLFTLNAQGAFNGHVPISAIIAFILAAAAIIYGFDTAVLSNERSANVGNLAIEGFDVNHQYSKSFDFESELAHYFQSLLPGFRYFSLLRPLSELEIAKLFSRSPRYHAVFSSCNGNYKLNNTAAKTARWCLNCPKCRFVFLALAPFLPKTELLAIFGGNLLADPAQQSGFAALVGRGTHKPFECVGEIEESQAAFFLLTQNPVWQQEIIVQWFKQDILPTIPHPESLVEQAFRFSPTHLIPPEFLEKLYAYRRS